MNQAVERRCVVLLSGGLDSATVLALARADGYACHALSVDYGQRHRHELLAAARVAASLGAAEHRVIAIDVAQFGGSALTDEELEVPAAPTSGIPLTYVPARNTLLLAIALGWAEVLDADAIARDFGSRSKHETSLAELFGAVEGVRYAKGQPLVALTGGMGLSRNTPRFRQLVGNLAQHAVHGRIIRHAERRQQFRLQVRAEHDLGFAEEERAAGFAVGVEDEAQADDGEEGQKRHHDQEDDALPANTRGGGGVEHSISLFVSEQALPTGATAASPGRGVRS